MALQSYSMPITVSVIIPCLDEQENLARLLPTLKEPGVEIIVVDGGSRDYSCDIASINADRLLTGEPGRALQMNNGARIASGDILLFLHADTRLPHNWRQLVLDALRPPKAAGGYFDLLLDNDRFIFRLIGKGASLRSRLFDLPYGDQALFVRKSVFREMGGYRPIPIMEDADFVRRLRRRGKLVFIPSPIVTSSRKWERFGVFRTTAAHWLVALGFLLSVPPCHLKTLYQRIISKQ